MTPTSEALTRLPLPDGAVTRRPLPDGALTRLLLPDGALTRRPLPDSVLLHRLSTGDRCHMTPEMHFFPSLCISDLSLRLFFFFFFLSGNTRPV